MTPACEVATKQASGAPLGFFERYLTLWVFLCIVAGTVLGLVVPEAAQAIGALEVAQVNLPVGLLIWVMIIPMLMKIDFAALHEVRQQKAGMAVTLLVNWAIKPFSMALIGWLFIKVLFADWLPAGELDSYMAGLILLGAAPCTAMVFVWSNLCNGNANFTLTQVALNDLVMVFAFAPIVALLLGVSSIPVPWDTLLLSVLMYIVIPLAIAQFLRAQLRKRGAEAFQAALAKISPFSILALLATLVLLFSFQGEAIVEQPLVIGLLAVPILLQTLFIAALGYWLCRRLRVRHEVAGPATMIGASNFFELAVAVAIVLYGFDSGAALATVVGVLIEVPVMLWLVRMVNRSRAWYERALPRP
ncbi:ACR3 family arsenite efflux transporter [Aquipseudomonas alcaligenes]|jgi:ACR3 family arsenite transporter|uniref:Arsenite export protein n=1 Tax=Aquipseudomonas alcaligenes (strain ATCC 14909 / DSM 50342 / CCUG 1425 / JCM 20561 / NBRC 14159 / NCIMB 9945 / NCTC 10367 / 1577) TaxID=1215092 RepID=U2ZM22_AQUA1|nr:ACR3 family arsenite efflux transporter [Pseudomonas alcaligenes]GAD62540.1 arsenite export protein [Pseudomonas alcaligenes NBRC 14159]SUD17977.1 arsenical-resistance protein [Pseudomonas alcaligenes]